MAQNRIGKNLKKDFLRVIHCIITVNDVPQSKSYESFVNTAYIMHLSMGVVM